MNDEFAHWLLNCCWYIQRHPNDFTPFQRRCGQVVYEWYVQEYCYHREKSRYIPDGAIEVVCGAFVDFRHDCAWEEIDFGHDKMDGYRPVHVYIGDIQEYQADILSDLQELRDAGDCCE